MTVPQQPPSCRPHSGLPISPADRWETLRVPAETRQAAQVRAFVRACAQNAGFDADAVADIELAVGEAATNAILYGCADCPANAAWITVIAGGANGEAVFFVEVWDPGAGFDPHQVNSTTSDDMDAVGGRGLPLMGALMDHVALHHEPERGMCVRLERRMEHRAGSHP